MKGRGPVSEMVACKKVEFYQLTRKFVDTKDVPPESKSLIYYSLAIGHHIGVLDCFSKAWDLDREDYVRWLERLPAGEGRRKLEGVLKWGEIEINQGHVRLLACTLSEALPDMTEAEQRLAHQLLRALRLIEDEPIVYLLVRAS
jgi:formate hydrogenlyase maturation protein HycH